MLPKVKDLPRGGALRGLTSNEARQRLKKFGPNVLPERPPPSNLKILISQLKSPLVYVLVVAGFVTLTLRRLADTVLIFGDVFLNTILGFIQERKADRALHALKKLIHPKAKVVRDGDIATVDASEVVPGDIAAIGQGDKIPADGELVFANRLFISEAILTGESVPVGKDIGEKVYMGTVVASGQGKLLVEITGKETEVGKIALSIQEPSGDTPLRRQLSTFSRQLALLVFFLTLFVFVVGVATGKQMTEIIVTSVALAVSSIPEGLLVALTVVLAIGMQRILKRRGLVRSLLSAETLGGVTMICIDKTGTLTQGKMQVVETLGDEAKLALQCVVANDLANPVAIAAYEWAGDKIKGPKSKTQDLVERYQRIDTIPFSSEQKFFASLNKWDAKKNMLFVNGAPEFLIEWSTMTKEKQKEIKDKIEELSSQGMKVMGLAGRKMPSSKLRLTEKDVKKDLTWLGALAFSDPVRPGVKEALEKTKAAGIKLMVITGDYSRTAVSVMEQLGISVNPGSVILGKNLKKMSVPELAKKVKGKEVRLFARTTPQQKLVIVEALKKNGEVVAMMGDGVNDAPALNRADIGIVVEEASDVAKETADLVLLDNNFATIVAAVEEGRGIFDNVRKIILYLMSDAFEEIIAVVGSLVLGLPLPVSAAQILWINLVSDGFPDLALTVDPKTEGIMKQTPRSPKENLVSNWMKFLIFIVSLAGGVMALSIFIFFYKTTGDLLLSRSITFAALGVNSLVYVFSIRTLRNPFWVENPFKNRWLNLSVVAGLGFQVMPFVFSGMRNFFGITPLDPIHWVLVFTAAGVMFIIIEVAKVVFRIRQR